MGGPDVTVVGAVVVDEPTRAAVRPRSADPPSNAPVARASARPPARSPDHAPSPQPVSLDDSSENALASRVATVLDLLASPAVRQRAVDAVRERYLVTVLLALGLVLWFELQLLVYHFHSAAAFRWLFTVRSVAPTRPGWLLSVVSHGTWRHLGVNVVMLLVFGGLAEPHLDRREFVAFFLCVGTVSSLAAVAVRPPHAPLVGASGALFGFLGFSLYHEARRHDHDLFPRRRRGDVVPTELTFLKVATVGVVFPAAALQVALGVAGAVPTGNTAVRTHAFGFLLGVLYEYWRPLLTGRRCG